MSWAQVKYLEENQRAEVETSFFKVVVEGLVKPEDLEVGDTYAVFWSPNPEETPKGIMELGNGVINVDELSELERRRRRKDGPLKGYYNAVLLALKEDEDIERPYKRELSGSNCLPSNVKRTKVPSARAIEAKLNSGTSKNAKNVKVTTARPMPEPNGGNKRVQLSKSTVQDSTKRNLTNLFNKFATKKSKSSGHQNTSDSDPDYEPDDCRVKDADYWRKKCESMEREMEHRGKPQKESVHRKNLPTSSQTQGKGLTKGGGSVKIVPTHSQSTSSARKGGEPEKTMEGNESPVRNDVDMDGFDDFSEMIDGADIHSPSKSQGFLGRHSSVMEEGNEEIVSTQPVSPSGRASSAPTQPVDPSSSDLSEDDFEIVPRRVKPPVKGPAGDSAALFQFCNTLWKPEELVVRSPTGLPPPTKKGAAAYPRMTPQKVDQCKDFLKKRILRENPRASDEEVDLRLCKVGYILGQVSSTRRSFRTKKIAYPSAEEILAEKKRKKEERRQQRRNRDKNCD